MGEDTMTERLSRLSTGLLLTAAIGGVGYRALHQDTKQLPPVQQTQQLLHDAEQSLVPTVRTLSFGEWQVTIGQKANPVHAKELLKQADDILPHQFYLVHYDIEQVQMNLQDDLNAGNADFSIEDALIANARDEIDYETGVKQRPFSPFYEP